MKPFLIDGGSFCDARGTLRFCNGFDLAAVRRFYTISNAPEVPRRGWIGHRRETKWFFPLRGTTVVSAETMDEVAARRSFALDASEPRVLCVPPGNWFLIEQHAAAEVMVFSDSLLGAFPNDDFRRPLP